jgi:hypothetical protein
LLTKRTNSRREPCLPQRSEREQGSVSTRTKMSESCRGPCPRISSLLCVLHLSSLEVRWERGRGRFEASALRVLRSSSPTLRAPLPELERCGRRVRYRKIVGNIPADGQQWRATLLGRRYWSRGKEVVGRETWCSGIEIAAL